MNYEKFGKEMSEFLRGLLGIDSTTSKLRDYNSTSTNSNMSAAENPYTAPTNYNDYNRNRHFTTESGIIIECNQAARLIPGHLLVVHKERCYQIDTDSGDITFVFQLTRDPKAYWWMAVPDVDGSVYCSISGSTLGEAPFQNAAFGTKGAVVKVNHIKDEIRVVAEGGNVVDPFGIELLHNNHLLVADFTGWGGSGLISIIDLRTGANEVLAQGGTLVDPQMATMDSDGIIWVANSMHRQYDGEIVRVDPGNHQTVVYPRHGPGSGIVSGIFPSNTSDKVLFVIIDWPFMVTSSVQSLDKATGEVEILLSGSVDDPKLFNAHGAVDNDILWIGESYNNEIIAYNLNSRRIEKTIDISGILGLTKGFGVKGVMDSFDFLECINIVPPQKA